MIILHSLWIPLERNVNSAPKIFCWAENALSFNYYSNSEEIQNFNGHPFSLNHEELIELWENCVPDFELKNFNSAMSAVKKRYTISLPIYQIFDDKQLPVLTEYLNYEGKNFPDQYSVLFDQIKKDKPNMRLENRDQGKFDIDGLLFDPAQFLYLTNNLTYESQTKEILEYENQTILVGSDFEYLLQLKNWVDMMIANCLIVPELIKFNQWYANFESISSNDTKNLVTADTNQNGKVIGWWHFHEDETIRYQILELSKLLPKSLHIVSGNTEDKSIKSDLSYTDQLLFSEISSFLLNTIIRQGSENEYKNYRNIPSTTLNNQPEIFFHQAESALFSDNPIFSNQSSSEIDWFIKKFNKWYVKDQSLQITNWKLSLLLIAPEEHILDDWYLSFILQNKNDRNLMITPDQIYQDDENIPYFTSKIDLFQILDQLFHQLVNDVPQLKDYININEIQPYYTISSSTIAAFLAHIPDVMEKLEYNLFLPKNLKSKFLPRSQIKLKLDVSTDNGLNFKDYSLSMMIGDQNYSIDEILKMAQSKAGLIQIHDKWIHFDKNEIKKVKNLVQKHLDSPTTLDLLRFEMEGIDEFKDLRFNSFNSDIITNATISEKLISTPDKIGKIKGIKAILRPYQRAGVEWLNTLANFQLGGILADDMGLGKTIQSIAMLLYRKNQKKSITSLVVCPTSVIGNWLDEFERFAPSMKIKLHHGKQRVESKKGLRKQMRQIDVLLTTYSITRRDVELLQEISWDGIILDEAQAIKNSTTKTHRAIVSLTSTYRFALTGTPIENNLSDLWSLFNFVTPGYLGTTSKFKDQFIKPITNGEEARLELLRSLISPFILRRYKNDPSIIKDLPDKIEKKVLTLMTPEQVSLYHAITNSALEKLEDKQGIQKQGIILSTMTRLKQVCNHPANYLRDKNFKIKRSGKFHALVDILETIFDNNEKVIIFSQFRVMCDLIENMITHRYNYPVFQLHGGTPLNKRVEDIEKFSKIIGSSVYIISLKAGGTGLNLHAANHVIHFDRWWNPAVEKQATDRAYRIGQKKDVLIYKFVTPGTLEEQIDTLLDSKSKLSDEVIKGLQGDITSMSADEFKELIKLRNVIEE